MAKDKTMIWVCPQYKAKLKSEAAIKGITMLDYTQLLSEGKVTKNKKSEWNFSLIK